MTTGVPLPEVQWYHDGQIMSEEAGRISFHIEESAFTLKNTSSTLFDGGKYTAKVYGTTSRLKILYLAQ